MTGYCFSNSSYVAQGAGITQYDLLGWKLWALLVEELKTTINAKDKNGVKWYIIGKIKLRSYIMLSIYVKISKYQIFKFI